MELTKNALAGHLRGFAEQLQRVGAELFRQAFKTQGIKDLSVQQLRYLELIEAKPGITPLELAGQFKVKKPTVSNLISRLEKAGLVRRVQGAPDKRVWRLFPTARTTRIFEKRRGMYVDLAEHIAKKLDKAEIETLLALFEKIRI